MLKLATVFSGIGAIEWALKRLNIDHKIVFACDNGEIDLDFENIDFKNISNKAEYIQNLYERSRKTNFVKKTYMANYNIDNDNFLYDVRFIDGYQYRGQVDLFVGGSPCQSFSIMGYQKGLDDTRGTLFYDFARLVKEIQPKVFIYENVQGLLKHDKGNTWEIIKKTFESLGYKISYQLLDSKDYDIPQTRRRIFVIGFLDHSTNFSFPKPKKLNYTMQDFLESNVKEGYLKSINGNLSLENIPGIVDEKYFLSEKVTKHVLSTGTKGYYTKPETDLSIARPLLSTMHKMHRAGVDNYVTENGKLRRLTPRECLRLMGYDDTFKIVVSDTQMYKQAGNSIVVDVMMEIIKNIMIAYPQIFE
ncbi:DNA cytosine methyltransferase [Catellicoccus marimammalium]|uniref:Cytosine-specific methyltransferase n=1 Tax=Catellicoccus marimammalium M35/04/3 TaxID=1234409 RepID=K8ZNG1_9ENTE|nr:DNA (cytosine-5-)-methyltransferase [Catellicoccus marimammalium]EKU27121.1 Modification methylase [Catellicoccus marimammalium M35/04/3]